MAKMAANQLPLALAGSRTPSAEPAQALDLATLESRLREVANILRGPLDAAGFRIHISPLLEARLRGLDEEAQAALQESDGVLCTANWSSRQRVLRFPRTVLDVESVQVFIGAGMGLRSTRQRAQACLDFCAIPHPTHNSTEGHYP